MLISAEIPIKNLEQLYKYIDFPFIINIYRDIPEYREFYIKACQEAEVSFLDNGLFESLEHGVEYDMSMKALDEGVNIFHPTYVFSEERYGDREFTVAKAKEFKEYFRDRQKIATCVHGSTFKDYIKCFYELMDVSDCLAFSHNVPFHDEIIDMIPSLKCSNMYTERSLVRMYIISHILETYHYDKPIHLLGCNNPIEIRYLGAMFNCIKTADTSSPILAGSRGVQYNAIGILPYGKIRQGAHFIDSELDINNLKEEIIDYNVKYLKGM